MESLKVKPEGARVAVSKQITDEKGNVLYEERDETSINPWTAQPERKVVYTTRKCEGCSLPLTAEMLSTDQVKPCILCGKVTCPRCRVNTEVTEYLKPEVRGQPLCGNCFHTFTRSLIIVCPSCDQPAKSYYDIKTCAGWCSSKVCPSCGIQVELGGLVCRRCHPKHVALIEELRSWQRTWT